VALVDRRVGSREGSGLDRDATLASAVARINLLRRVLSTAPVSVMARRPRPELTEAVVALANGARAILHLSFGSGRSESRLRIDGDRGVLLATPLFVAWRKRGWPIFVPILVPGVSPSDAVGSSGDDRRWAEALADAVMQSDRTRRLISLATVAPGAPVKAR
jgi:hypothetical protein